MSRSLKPSALVLCVALALGFSASCSPSEEAPVTVSSQEALDPKKPESASDRTGPIVILTSPADGSEVSAGRIEISGTSQDKISGVVSVDIFLDGKLMGTSPFMGNGAASPADFSYELDVPAGSHKIMVKSADGKGNESFTTATVEAAAASTEAPPVATKPISPTNVQAFTFPGNNSRSHSVLPRSPFLTPVKSTPQAPSKPSSNTPTPFPGFPFIPTPTPPAAPPVTANPPAIPPSVDATPPSVRIITPLQRQAINVAEEAVVVLTGEAEDASSIIARVNLNVGGVDMGDIPLMKTGSLYSFTSSFTPFDGPQSIVVTAFDAAGNATSTSRDVIISSPGNMIPNVDLDIEASAEVESTILSATANTLTLDSATSPVEEGEIVIIGITDATPEGAIRRVTSISVVNGYTVLETETAALTEAFTQLSFNTTIPLSDAPPPASSARSRVAAAANILSMTWGVEVDETMCVNVKARKVECDASDKIGEVNAKASATTTFEVGIEVELEIDRDSIELVPDVQKFSAILSGTRSSEIDANISAAFGWESEEKKIVLDKIPPVTIMAGPFPIVFKPQVELSGKLGWTVDGELSYNAKDSATQQIGARYASGEGWSGVSEVIFDTSSESTAELNGEIHVDLEAVVYVEVSGVAGPTINLNVTPALTGAVSAVKSASLSFDTLVEAGVGVRVEVLSKTLLEWSNPDLFSKSFNLFFLGGYNLLELNGESLSLEAPTITNDHRVQFEAVKDTHVRLKLGGDISADATAVLTNSSGVVEVEAVDGFVDFIAPSSDTYRLALKSASGTSGEITGVIAGSVTTISSGAWAVLDVVTGLGQAQGVFSVPANYAWDLDFESVDTSDWKDGILNVIDSKGVKVFSQKVRAGTAMVDFEGSAQSTPETYTITLDSNGLTSGSVKVLLGAQSTPTGPGSGCGMSGETCTQELSLSSALNFIPGVYSTPASSHYYTLDVEEGQIIELSLRTAYGPYRAMKVQYDYYREGYQEDGYHQDAYWQNVDSGWVSIRPTGIDRSFVKRAEETGLLRISFVNETWGGSLPDTQVPFDFLAREVRTINQEVVSGEPFELVGLAPDPVNAEFMENPFLNASFEAQLGDKIIITMPTIDEVAPVTDQNFEQYGLRRVDVYQEFLVNGFKAYTIAEDGSPAVTTTTADYSGPKTQMSFIATGSGTHSLSVRLGKPFFNHQMKFPFTVTVIPAAEIS